MSFLNDMANKLEKFYDATTQASFGQTENKSLSSVENGKQIPFGALGEFAKKIDKSAIRSYAEDGFLKTDLFNSKSKQLEILMQEPTATILIKKRMFSSLANNFRPDFMSADEKLFYKSCKILFKNKCLEISALERLFKLNKILELNSNYIDDLLPTIIGAVDSLTSASNSLGFNLNSNNASKLLDITNKIRNVMSFSNQSRYTTWLSDLNENDTGVMELTNVTSFNTNVGLDRGQASFSISDPYNKMLVTESDIEKALSDATDSFYNKNFFKFSQLQTDNLLNSYISRFNLLRKTRGASGISFKTNANTVLSKRVIAVVDRVGIEILFDYKAGVSPTVDVDNEFLIGGSLLENDGLDTNLIKIQENNSLIIQDSKDSEISLFKKIITTIFTKLTLASDNHNSYQLRNEKTNYARKKMRMFFLGRSIIQTMDEVSIFINSKAQYDSKVLAGLKSSLNQLDTIQNLSNSIYDLKNSFNSVFNPSGSIDIQIEKEVYVGKEFPDRLWIFLRNLFVSNTDGVCVFSGLTKAPTTSYSDGRYTVNVSCVDKLHYLEMGKVNFNPGIDNFNGAIFDQVTPFKSKFDQQTVNFGNDIPELLDENKAILSSGSSKGLLKFKAGPGVGQFVSEDNFISDVTSNPTTGQKERYLYGPDGLAYNWKQGIGMYVAFGNSLDINDPNKVGVPSLFKNPFAGQDVMNVVSLLVTGRPYNFANYWRTVSNLDGFQTDPYSNKSGAHSYFATLQNELTKNNVLWGNFIPFKTLSIDEQAFAKVLSSEFSINRKVKELDDKLQEYQKFDTGVFLASGRKDINDVSSGIIPTQEAELIKQRMSEMQKDIQKLQQEISVLDEQKGLSITGDVSFSLDGFINNEDSNSEANDLSARKKIRRRINELTKRVAWKVRSNSDNNLFIVDDSYDKDFDFAAFESNFNNLELYNNDFTSVLEKVSLATNLLNLEFYCDTQGNIRVNPPKYNSIPSSVFYRLTNLKKNYGIKLYSDFLDVLFKDQLQVLKEKIEVIEDEIRLAFALLDINDDFDILMYVANLNTQGDTFGFVTNDFGLLDNFTTLASSSDPDIFSNNETLSFIQNQAKSNKSFFTPKNRSDIVLSLLTPENRSKFDNASTIISSSRVTLLKDRIKTKTGKPVNLDDYYFNISTISVDFAPKKAIDLVTVTNLLSNKLSERQRTIKLFYESLKNSIELRSVDNTNTVNSLLTPAASMSSIPEMLSHLIEDESYDDLGPGSGSRYILRNSRIKSLEFSENEPEFTSVQVNGSFNQFESIQGSGDLTSAINANLGLSSAFAIDYDLWRMYGLKNPSTVNVPFLTDPKSQLAPYASTLLSKARKNILKASVTIAGNEFQQPGEVVYLEDNQLLYYVRSVSHSFTYGSGFSTTMDLEYGHAPGDYIPNVFDTVGKIIYNNKDNIDFINYRHENSLDEINIGVIILDENASSAIQISDDKNQYISKYSSQNAKTIQDIINTISYQLNINNVKNNPISAKLELRIYYDSTYTTKQDLLNLREDVKQILIGQKQVFNTNNSKIQGTIDKEFISSEYEDVDIGLEDDPRSPSQKALSISRDIYEKSGQLKDDLDTQAIFAQLDNSLGIDSDSSNISAIKNGIKRSLFKYIIDCYVKFETKEII